MMKFVLKINEAVIVFLSELDTSQNGANADLSDIIDLTIINTLLIA